MDISARRGSFANQNTDPSGSIDRHGEAVASGFDKRRSSRLSERIHSMIEDRWDPNLPSPEDRIETEKVVKDIDECSSVLEIQTEENSPYLEVAAVVPNYDEDVPANTFRAWFLGLFFATLGTAITVLLSLRSPSIQFPVLVSQILAYPAGVLMAKYLPKRQFNTFGYRWSLNPGPFNRKEHAVIVIMSNATYSGGVSYATDIILAQNVYYKQAWGLAYQLLLIISSQCLGYGLAGMARKYLVWPGAMIWPVNLPTIGLFNTLHDTNTKANPAANNGWRISRYRFFLYVLIGSFVWTWFPGYLAQFLSNFAFATWIAPKDVIVNQLFGGNTGLSLIPLTFDWSMITQFINSPLVPPFHAIVNITIGVVAIFVMTSAGIHYSGAWYSKYLPLSTSGTFDHFGKKYDVSKILTPDFTFDEQKYKKYSPLFLSTNFALAYGTSFATIAAVLVHTLLFHSKEIKTRSKQARTDEPDIHNKMMLKYADVPWWWYPGLLLVMTSLSLTVCLAFPTHFPAWAFFLAFLLPCLFIIPIGMIQAISNIQIGLNVITEFIIGYMLPGRPVAMMLFKTFGYIPMAQALTFCSDLKLGQYMKIPPRLMFTSQLVATLWASIVQIGVLNWAMTTIKGVCTAEAPKGWTCPGAGVFFNASIIWGVIGPGRMFSPGQIYSGLMWFFLIGALLPVVIFVGVKMFPRSPIRYLCAPVILGGGSAIPPATPLTYLSWAMVGMTFNGYIKRKFKGWWTTYNYILSAGLDAGLAFAATVIFFALTLWYIEAPSWWGNNVNNETLDGMSQAIQVILPKGQFFGPKSW